MPPSKIRSFIALYPDARAREHIAEYVSRLRAHETAVRWEREQQIHVTLKFLGDVTPSVLDGIAASLRERLEASGALECMLDTVGAFPSLKRARVVWLGFSQPVARISELQRIVADMCEKAGMEKDNKTYTPHFTIGRAKDRNGVKHLENVVHTCSFHSVPVHFGAVRIMESTLTSQGAIHKERIAIQLTPGE